MHLGLFLAEPDEPDDDGTIFGDEADEEDRQPTLWQMHLGLFLAEPDEPDDDGTIFGDAADEEDRCRMKLKKQIANLLSWA